MTRELLDDLKRQEALLLNHMRLVHVWVEKLKGQLSDACVVDIDYDDRNDCLRYVCEGADDDYLGVRYEEFNSIDALNEDGCIMIEEER